MRLHHLWSLAAAGVLGLTSSGCNLDIAQPPPEKIVDVLYDFCSNDIPIWFAYENRGARTTRIMPNAEGTFSFTASNRVAIAYVHQKGSDYHTQLIYTTSAELEHTSGSSCLEESGSNQLNGSVSGVSPGQVALVGMNFASAYLESHQTSYTLSSLADRPLDLVASRINLTPTSQTADRVFIRRNLGLVNNATLPLVDFTAGDVVVPATSNAIVSGLVDGEQTLLQNNLFTQLETSHTLSATDGIFNGARPFVALPATQLVDGDYHDLVLLAVSPGSLRGAERYFRAPGDQTLEVGPALEMPVVGVLATEPYLRFRVSLPAQQAYRGAVIARFSQQHQFSETTVTVLVTLGYLQAVLGGWIVDIVNLSGADGWQNTWGLQNTSEVQWSVTALDGRPELLFGAKPDDGETVTYATRFSTPPAGLREHRAGHPSGLRLRPLSRAR